MNILSLISSRNFITLNKDLIKIFGLEEAIMIGELCSEADYWNKEGKLEDGYFFSTVEKIQENTTLSEHKQRKAIANLKKKNIIDVKIKGLPAKRYIKVNEEELKKYFGAKNLKKSSTSSLKIKELEIEKSQTSSLKIEELVPENFKRNNNINNNKEEEKEINKEKVEEENFNETIPEENNKSVIDYYNNNITLISPTVAEEINYYLDDGLTEGLIKRCIKEAVDQNARKWKYIKTILDNCKKDNIRTVEEFEINQKEFREKQKKKTDKQTFKEKLRREVKYNTDFSEYDKYIKGDDESGQHKTI